MNLIRKLFISIFICQFAYAQYEMPLPPSQTQTINSGALIIPMDTVNQKIPGYFNLKAYGLVNELLQNEIPVMWAIKAGKTKINNATSIDFQATANRVFPDTSASSNIVFRSSAFIIADEWVATALPVINAYAGSVAIYKLNTSTSIDIRYTLTFKPKIGLINSNGYDTITVHVLQEAGYSASSYQLMLPAGTVFNTSQQFSLISDSHFTGGDTTHVNPVIRFASIRGGNFIANCTAQGAYENHSLTMTTAGIDTVSSSITALAYSNHDLPVSQFQGGLRLPHGEFKYWRLKTGSTFRSSAYNVMTGTATAPFAGVPLKIVAGTKLKPTAEKGGNIYYLSGHDFYYYTQPGSANENDRINGRRIFLNTTLIPPSDSVDLDFTTDVTLGIDAQLPVVKDEACTLTLSVNNLKGGTGKNVAVTAPLPAGLVYLQHSSNIGSFNPGTGIWNIGNVPRNTNCELTITAKVSTLGTIIYPGTVTNTALELIKANNFDTLFIYARSRPVAVNDTTTFTGPFAIDKNTKVNDSDEDGDFFGNTSIVSGPFNGTATVLNSDIIRYSPSPSFTGTDSLLYITCDPWNLCDTAWLIIHVITPLPVELGHFSGRRENSILQLYWMTLSEKENDHFDIEESIDGKSFKLKGQVKGNGTSIEVHHYEFSAADISAPVAYYRLRQFDFNGEEHLSHVIALQRKEGNAIDFLISPNPVDKNGALIVQCALQEREEAILSINDLAGRTVYSRAIKNQPDLCEVIRLPSGLESGCYYVAITTAFRKSGCMLIVR